MKLRGHCRKGSIALFAVFVGTAPIVGCKSVERPSRSELTASSTDIEAIFKKAIYNAGSQVGVIHVYPTVRISKAVQSVATATSLNEIYRLDPGLNANLSQKLWSEFQRVDQSSAPDKLTARIDAVRKIMKHHSIVVPADLNSKPIAMVIMKFVRNLGGGSSQMVNMGISISSTQLQLSNSNRVSGQDRLDDPDWAKVGARQLGQELRPIVPDYERYLDQTIESSVQSSTSESQSTTRAELVSAIFHKWGEYLNYLGVGLLGVQDDFRFTKLLAGRPNVLGIEFDADANMDEMLEMEVRLVTDEQYQAVLKQNPLLKAHERVWSP